PLSFRQIAPFRMWIPVDNENMAEASAFVTSIRRMCPMAGMPASCSRRPRERCCAETCLRGLETALRSPKVISSNLQLLRKICSTTPVLVRLQGRPFASLPTSNRRFWLPCTARHFPVTGQLPLGPWVITTTFACARHRAKLSCSPRCLLMGTKRTSRGLRYLSAFGAKRTLTEPRLQKPDYDYTSSRSHRDRVAFWQRHADDATQREQPRALCAIRLPPPAASSGWPSIRHGTGGRRARNPRETTSQAASEGRFRGKPITSLDALPSLPSRGWTNVVILSLPRHAHITPSPSTSS